MPTQSRLTFVVEGKKPVGKSAPAAIKRQGVTVGACAELYDDVSFGVVVSNAFKS